MRPRISPVYFFTATFRFFTAAFRFFTATFRFFAAAFRFFAATFAVRVARGGGGGVSCVTEFGKTFDDVVDIGFALIESDGDDGVGSGSFDILNPLFKAEVSFNLIFAVDAVHRRCDGEGND